MRLHSRATVQSKGGQRGVLGPASYLKPRKCLAGLPGPPSPHMPRVYLEPQLSLKRRRVAVTQAGSCCGGAKRADQGHSHDHGHAHSHFPDNFLTTLFKNLGLVAAAERISHSSACLWASLLCFACASVAELPAVSSLLPPGQAPLLSSAALCVPWVLSGAPQILESLCMAASGVLNTHVLMALAAVGTLYMGMPQEGALLLLLFQLSHTLEEHFTSRARGNLARLFASVPDKAQVVEMDANGVQPLLHTQELRLADSVSVGQHVLVNSGENVPLDGVVVWGTASVSLQHISGESAPVRVVVGSEVPAGSVNLDGSLVLGVRASMEDSTPARIARMAAEAQANRPKLQRTLDRVGEIWSKAVIAATLAALVGLLAMGVPLAGPRGALYRAMGVLTAGSPCAVVLVPLAYVCAIATITRKGVLVKSASAIDALLTCNTIAVDKTGTITSGVLTLVDASVFSVSPQVHAGAALTAAGGQRAGSATAAEGACMLSHEESNRLGRLPASAGKGGEGPGLHLRPLPIPRGLSSQDDGSSLGNGSANGLNKRMPLDSNSPSSSSSSNGEMNAWAVGAEHSMAHNSSGDHEAAARYGSTSSYTPSSTITSSASGPDSGPAPPAALSPPSSAPQGTGAFELRALQYAVALSRFSNHPVSQAVVAQLGPLVDTQGVAVHHVRQVPGAGVQGLCQGAQGAPSPEFVSFGSLSFIRDCLPAGPAREQLEWAAAEQSLFSTARAQSFLLATPTSLDTFNGISAEAAAAAAQTVDSVHSNGHSHGAVAAAWEDGHGSFVSHDQEVAVMCFEDAVQPGARQAVDLLQRGAWSRRTQAGKQQSSIGLKKEDKKEVVMLTGDNAKVASQVAATVGITSFEAELKPEDKLAYVERFNKSSRHGADGPAAQGGLAMVGDGINDAPALAAARVGVAVAATPSDLVAAAADITILNGQGVANLPWLFAVASRTHMIIRQNMVLALGAVVAATLPTVAGVLPLSMAVLLHEGSTLLVVVNSLRLLIDPGESTVNWARRGGWRAAVGSLRASISDHKHHHHHHHHHHDEQPHSHDHHHHHHHHHHHDDEQHAHHNEHVHAHSHDHSHPHHHDEHSHSRHHLHHHHHDEHSNANVHLHNGQDKHVHALSHSH